MDSAEVMQRVVTCCPQSVLPTTATLRWQYKLPLCRTNAGMLWSFQTGRFPNTKAFNTWDRSGPLHTRSPTQSIVSESQDAFSPPLLYTG
jgi:hypothetical protein